MIGSSLMLDSGSLPRHTRLVTSPPPEISPLRHSEIQVASAVLTAALADDPGWTHVLPRSRSRQLALAAVTRVALRDALPFAGVIAAREAGRLTGLAVWLSPGRYPMSWLRKARTVPAMTALALRIPREIRQLSRFGDSIDEAFPDEPVQYLQVLGVRPDRQRRGLGRRLLQPGLAEADRAGVSCYLETSLPQNIAYYQRSGFSAMGPLSPLYPGGPPMVRMTRSAAGS